MNNPGAASSGESMPDGLGLNAWSGIAIFLSVMGFNCLGDGLRDALDPRMRARVGE
jgi:ABC-type dipeptide/oligopeptide/nickel transport system permease subunit